MYTFMTIFKIVVLEINRENRKLWYKSIAIFFFTMKYESCIFYISVPTKTMRGMTKKNVERRKKYKKHKEGRSNEVVTVMGHEIWI